MIAASLLVNVICVIGALVVAVFTVLVAAAVLFVRGRLLDDSSVLSRSLVAVARDACLLVALISLGALPGGLGGGGP